MPATRSTRRDWLARTSPWNSSDCSALFVTVCNTIAYAHSRGVIHRDLKGQNVVLADFGEVVVLDWGLAKLMGDSNDDAPTLSRVCWTGNFRVMSGLTVAGQTLGTPAYMAPEQAAGILDQIDVRTDVYGLGSILYEILTGQPPFCGSDTQEVLRKVREEPPIPPSGLWPDVPAALETVCRPRLAKRPADRYGSASELALDVQGWQETQRRQAEEALRNSEALYHSLVESIPLSVFRKDLDGRFTFGNRRFCEGHGNEPRPAHRQDRFRPLHPRPWRRNTGATTGGLPIQVSHSKTSKSTITLSITGVTLT